MTEGGVYCIVSPPNQHGDLWVEVGLDAKTVKVLDPAGKWWRGREFTMEEFQQIVRPSQPHRY